MQLFLPFDFEFSDPNLYFDENAFNFTTLHHKAIFQKTIEAFILRSFCKNENFCNLYYEIVCCPIFMQHFSFGIFDFGLKRLNSLFSLKMWEGLDFNHSVSQDSKTKLVRFYKEILEKFNVFLLFSEVNVELIFKEYQVFYK